jgi:hypothetical protein
MKHMDFMILQGKIVDRCTPGDPEAMEPELKVPVLPANFKEVHYLSYSGFVGASTRDGTDITVYARIAVDDAHTTVWRTSVTVDNNSDDISAFNHEIVEYEEGISLDALGATGFPEITQEQFELAILGAFGII